MIQGVRNFKLINQYGAEYDMTRPEALFTNPSGLGWGISSTTERLGDTFFIRKTDYSQPAPSGEMVFRTYKEYDIFLKFCQIGGLVLAYMTGEEWRYLEVDLSIDKGDISPENDHLVCQLSFTGLSQWYKKTVLRIGEDEEGNGKLYPYSYPYTYGRGAGSVFELDLALPSYFKLTVLGPCENVRWNCIQNGEILHTGAVKADIGSTHKFVVNTLPTDMKIAEYDLMDKEVQNLYKNSDFNTTRIYALPRGESRLVVTDTSLNKLRAFLEVREYV